MSAVQRVKVASKQVEVIVSCIINTSLGPSHTHSPDFFTPASIAYWNASINIAEQR